MLRLTRKEPGSISDQAAERFDSLRLVRAAGLDRYRAADARGEEHDREDVARVCCAPVKSERNAAPEPGGEHDDTRGELRMHTQTAGYIDLTRLHSMNDRTPQRPVVARCADPPLQVKCLPA